MKLQIMISKFACYAHKFTILKRKKVQNYFVTFTVLALPSVFVNFSSPLYQIFET